MSSQKGSKLYNTFVKGLVTDASEIAPVENSSIEEDNCVLSPQGFRQRRLGLAYEPGAVLSSFTFDNAVVGTDIAIGAYNWNSVNNKASKNFLVIQVGNSLKFYDQSATPLSTGLKSFSVDLSTFATVSSTESAINDIEVTVGRGNLFVCSPAIDPFYIQYNADTDTITSTKLELKIRDTVGLVDGHHVDYQPLELSIKHHYNLKNQGWTYPLGTDTDVYINGYKSAIGRYPANNQQWWVGRMDDGGTNYQLIGKTDFGTTYAARGRYILNPFYKDRSDASGVSGIKVETVTERPSTSCFYSGRVFWAGVNSDIFYSQIIKSDFSNAGNCYQEADPTAEDINDLVESDGGVVTIPDAAGIVAIRSINSTVIVLATNGVWAIQGNSNSGFKATDYQITQVSTVGCVSRASVLELEQALMWWGDTGIYVLSFGSYGQPEIKSASHNVIQNLYTSIDADAKKYVRGSYDKSTKVVSWLYKAESNDSFNRHAYDMVLNLDTEVGAYYTYSMNRDVTFPYIVGSFATPQLNGVISEENVSDSTDVLVVDNSSEQVVIQSEQITSLKTFTKFLTIVPNGTNSKITFSLFSDNNLKDWFNYNGVGLDYESYLITTYLVEGEVAKRKDAPYILCFFRRTEDGWIGSDDEGFNFTNQSSCFLESRWEWANSSNSNRWSSPQQVYRFRQRYNPDSTPIFDNGYPVVVTKNRVRGSGRSLHLKFGSESGKDFILLGWYVVFNMKGEE